MSGDKTTPSETVTRPDDDVGASGTPPAGGGHRTDEPARLTALGPGGRAGAPGGEAPPPGGYRPAPVGGSSGGHSDQTATDQAAGKAAQGHYKVEKERG